MRIENIHAVLWIVFASCVLMLLRFHTTTIGSGSSIFDTDALV